MRSIAPITQALIIANVAVFLGQMGFDDFLVHWFALWPLGPAFEPWQIVTYAFLHGSVPHLFLNMFALYMFGSDIEEHLHPRRYLQYYVYCVLSAGLAQLLVAAMSPAPSYPTVGASGGVYGVLLAFGLYFPRRIVVLLIPPIPMPALILAIVCGLVEVYLGVTNTLAGVAHFAHLGGMLGGFITIQYWRGRWPFGRPGW